MAIELRNVAILFVFLLVIQLAGIFTVFSEKYECRAVIQIQPATSQDQFNVCNVETIRGLLERWDLDSEVKKRFDLEKDDGPTQQPLIPRRFQEADPNNNLFAFRFRHKSAETAQGVVTAFLEGIERSWRSESEAHFKSVLEGELNALQRNLGLMETQSAKIPQSLQMLASSTSPGISSVFSGAVISYPNPEYEHLITDRNLTIRRIEEINLLLSQSSLAAHKPLRWTILARPTKAERPLWPTRMDLAFLALVNSLVWSAAFFLWRRFRAS